MTRLKIFFTILSILLVSSEVSYAQLGVEPVRVEIEMSKGEETEGSYLVWHNFKKPVQIMVKTKEWFKLKENRDISLDTWLRISPKELLVAPGKKGEFKWKVSVPNNAVGELAGMVSFTPSEKTGPITTVMSVPIYVAIKDTSIKRAKIEKIVVRRGQSKEHSNIRVAVVIKNTGNVHLRPSGKVLIKDKKGREIKVVSLASGWPVYPGRVQPYFADWEDASLKAGKYKAIATVDYGDPENILKKTVSFEVDKKGNFEMGNK